MTNLRLALLKMILLRSSGARLFATALLSLPLAIQAKKTSFVLETSASHVGIAVKATVDSFVARLESYDVAITMDSETGRVESATFHAQLAAVKTGRSDRDRDMSVWLQTSEFPQVAFELTGMDQDPDGSWTARGRVQLHGHQHEVSFPVKIMASRGGATIDGTADLDTREFGLPIIRKYWVLTVAPVVHVRFHLQGKLAQ